MVAPGSFVTWPSRHAPGKVSMAPTDPSTASGDATSDAVSTLIHVFVDGVLLASCQPVASVGCRFGVEDVVPPTCSSAVSPATVPDGQARVPDAADQ